MGIAERTALVYKKGRFCGYLKKTDAGYAFEYDRSYLSDKANPPLLPSVPKTAAVYRSPILFPCFDNLLPEGENLGKACHQLGISPEDRFACLLFLSKDLIGDIRIIEDD